MQLHHIKESLIDISDYISSLVGWYKNNKRDLPWRETDDPYIIWISEIILQQTRVNQGYAYFERFIGRFPDVVSLAEASEDEVLKLWQGLGYYSRARNLHAAAKDITDRFDGIFPSEHKDVISLKGVGEYTAAAIVSFAYNQPYAVVDGNVFRVLSRLFMIDTPIDTGGGKKVFQALAQQILDKKNPGIYNQAIMELGALQCVPSNPGCSQCPLSHFCLAYASGKVAAYPVKQGKTKVRNRYFNYLDIRDENGCAYLNKRVENDIWKNLYELPLIESGIPLEVENLLKEEQFGMLFGVSVRLEIKHAWQTKHVLSHQIIYADFYQVKILKGDWENDRYIKIPPKDIDLYPISRLVHRYIENHHVE